MTAPAKLTAIVLAGGRSSRFGGDKLASELGGRALLDRAIDAVRPVADEILVVGRSGDTAGVTYVADDRPFEGPLSGLATGMRVASCEVVLAVAGDMPALHPGVLALLAGGAGPNVAVGLEQAGSIRPLPIALVRGPAIRAAEELLAGRAPRERSLRAFLVALGATSIPESRWLAIDPQAGSLLDVDTAADLDRLRERA